MAKIPRSRQKRTIVPIAGTEPYRILETAIQKKTSVSTEPQRWMLAKRGIPKFTRSFLRGFALDAHRRATGRVAAKDI